MAKVIMLATQFPVYHLRKGQPTLFVEKFLKGFENKNFYPESIYTIGELLGYMYADDMLNKCDNVYPKYHTIRAGNRFKAGDYFSPRIWSGKPYRSKQIIIAPDIEVKKVWDFEIKDENILLNGKLQDQILVQEVAKNDGLENKDFLDWFKYPKPFKGQIICWNENINY